MFKYINLAIPVLFIFFLLLFIFTNRKKVNFDKRIALHESGHAMFLAGYASIPKIIHISIERKNNSYNGFVYSYSEDLDNSNKEHIKFMMLNCLAGKMAEKTCKSLGQINLTNSSDDLRQWNEYALLLIGKDKNKVIQYVNLIVLQYRQERLIKNFFNDNLMILEEISELLIDKKTLFYKDIQPLLKKVNYPKNFPMISTRN